MLNTPYNNSNPLSIQTHSKVHYLYIMKTNLYKYVGMLVTYVYIIVFVVIVVVNIQLTHI